MLVGCRASIVHAGPAFSHHCAALLADSTRIIVSRETRGNWIGAVKSSSVRIGLNAASSVLGLQALSGETIQQGNDPTGQTAQPILACHLQLYY